MLGGTCQGCTDGRRGDLHFLGSVEIHVVNLEIDGDAGRPLGVDLHVELDRHGVEVESLFLTVYLVVPARKDHVILVVPVRVRTIGERTIGERFESGMLDVEVVRLLNKGIEGNRLSIDPLLHFLVGIHVDRVGARLPLGVQNESAHGHGRIAVEAEFGTDCTVGGGVPADKADGSFLFIRGVGNVLRRNLHRAVNGLLIFEGLCEGREGRTQADELKIVLVTFVVERNGAAVIGGDLIVREGGVGLVLGKTKNVEEVLVGCQVVVLCVHRVVELKVPVLIGDLGRSEGFEVVADVVELGNCGGILGKGDVGRGHEGEVYQHLGEIGVSRPALAVRELFPDGSPDMGDIRIVFCLELQEGVAVLGVLAGAAVGMCECLTVTDTVGGVGVGGFAALVGVAVHVVDVRLLTAYVVAIALSVCVVGQGTGTARGVVVLGDGAVTGAVAVGVQLQSADGRCLCRGDGLSGGGGVGNARGSHTVVGVVCTQVEPVVVGVEEVVDG